MIPFNTEIFDLFGCLWCREFPTKEMDRHAYKPIFYPADLEFRDVEQKRTLQGIRLEEWINLAMACHDTGDSPCKTIRSLNIPVEHYKMSEVKELVS